MVSKKPDKNKIDREKTLEQIENIVYGTADYGSYLVTTVYQLRKKPLKDFTIEDLRIMIGQNFSLDILIPLAIEKLNENILAEGHFYPGDLLNSVLTSDHSFWVRNKDLHEAVNELLEVNRNIFEPINRSRKIWKNIEQFQQLNQ